MNVMLLAAGEGTRLRPYTLTLPKPAIPFLNIPLAAHSLSFIHDISVDKLVVNTYHLPEKIHQLFEGLNHGAKKLIFSDEKGEILGSGGGLGKARKAFQGGGDFIMMNADEIILPEQSAIMTKAVDQHKKKKNIATLLVKDHPGVGTQFGGVWVDKSNRVLGFGKNPLPGSVRAWHFIGVQILSEEVFDFIPLQGASNILYDALTQAIEQGFHVEAFPFECQWFETGNPVDFLEATSQCLEILAGKDSAAKSSLQKTLKKFGASFEIEHIAEAVVLRDPSSKIAAHAELSGFICLGKNSVLNDKCHLHNVVVHHNVSLNSSVKAQDCLIL